jgi:hypothetical protein
VLIRFFERYVHDSLAGFDTDETRTSDSRVVYIGDDKILTASTETKSKTKVSVA